MKILNIVFWVCIVEAVFKHVPWTAPLAVLGTMMLINLIVGKKKKENDVAKQEKINKVGNRK